MCAIFGFTRRTVSAALAVEGFAQTLSRGPDMSRFTECGPGWLGFHRLAIMGLDASGMQPFRLGGDMCVCNGELYGFRPLKTELVGMGYRFRSGSDCEILLPMYREYGTDMFAMLDAEFACIIYDSARDKFIAARDPLGIRPLYYGELPAGGMAFASEPKNLTGVCREIRPFPPGHYWDGGFHRYSDLTTVSEYSPDGEEEAARHIRELLIQAVDKRLDSDAPVGFLLSGGLDSSLVCSIASRLLQRPIRTFAIGMDTDPIDLKYARHCADFLGSEHTEVTMSLDEVLCQAGVAGIEGVDTRALTLSIRDKGARNAVICPEDRLDEASSFLASFPDITQRDLIASVAVTERVRDPELPEGFAKVPASARHRIALVDFGIKTSIISCFYERGVAVDLLPPDFKAEDVLDKGYGMLFLSNGPGDPARLTDQVAQVARCITKIPVCGICLGHQLITWALGGRTVKMVYGHHGGNQPVKDLDTGKSFVSAQNHNYMSDMDSLPKGVRLWFTNANDGTVEGIYDEERRVRSVQFHPEACPGPHDGRWIFDAFIKEMER